MLPTYWNQAIEELSKKDKKLKQLIEQHSDVKLQNRGDAFQTLIRSIIGQQISGKAASSIWNKLVSHFKEVVSYQKILKSNFEDLKQLGLSSQKSNYIHNLANHFKENKIKDATYWQNRNYSGIHKELIAIKGIGNWTVEMFGIFYLLEADLFPIKDLGIIKAVRNIYGKNKELSIDEINKLSNKWKPWRTVATCFLWRSIDASVINY